MTKNEFILSLNEKLAHLPKTEVSERLNFYIEMIDDRMEEGFSEAKAVEAIGSVDEIVAQISADVSPAPVKPKRTRSAWQIVLLWIGAPVWISLLIAVGACALALYACLWAVVVSMWAILATLAVCSAFGIVNGCGLLMSSQPAAGVALIGVGLFGMGIGMFWIRLCALATRGMVRLTAWCLKPKRKGTRG